MSAYAPVPWKIGKGTDRGQIIDSEGERVCRLTNDPTAVANARLIAAAPEILTLLLEIRKWMDGEAMGAWDAKFIAKIDAAVAKAEGRQ